MITETIHYQCNGVTLNGYLACTESSWAKRPAIIVAHAWQGQDDFAQEKARDLAELGYVGFAADMYGNGQHVETSEEALKLMLPLFQDRKLLRERIIAAVDAVKSHHRVNPEAIGAIGFCFGGLTVIELLRSGAPVRGVASFHGLLGYTFGDYTAKKVPTAANVDGSLLILHGHKDPLVSAADIKSAQEDFTNAGIDWQMNTYGQAMHAFTNPQANDPSHGLMYNQEVAFRSWLAMCNFFEDIFPA